MADGVADEEHRLRRSEIVLPEAVFAAALAREAVRESLIQWGVRYEGTIGLAELVAVELVVNAI
jgi:hypothetical protein